MENKRFIFNYYKLYSLHTEIKKSKKIIILPAFGPVRWFSFKDR